MSICAKTAEWRPGTDGALGKWLGLLALPFLYVVSRYNFLLFHSLAELFAAVVAFCVFVLAWNSRRVLDNNYLLFLGIAFPFIGILHLVHALAYKGMGVFTGYDPYIATQLWIVARFSLAAAFLTAPLFLDRKANVNVMFVIWTVITALMLMAVFVWDVFPALFIEGHGLTSFKKASESAISLMLAGSLVPLYRKRHHFPPKVFGMLMLAVVAALVAELPFTLYSHVFDWLNALGHLFSIGCFYLVYLALIVTGLQQPQELLFRNLRQREQALSESQARLTLALNAGQMGTWDWNLETGHVEWSEGYYALLGYRVGEIKPSVEAFRNAIHPEDRERQSAAVAHAMNEKAEYFCEFRLIRQDGSVHWVEARGRFVYDEAGKAVGMYGVLISISLRKQSEAERQNLLEAERAARAEAERLNRMKDEFLATVSHELRSPLSAIVGWTRLLADGRVSTDKAGKVIGRSAATLTRIVEDLLDMGRIVSGKVRLAVEPARVENLVENVIEGVQFAAQARSIHLEVSYDPDLPMLNCDPGRLQQIVWNLVTNAIKFTPEGGRVIVAVSRTATHITIQVTDTGKGIASEFLPYVFERFRQEDGGVARRQGGLGLGLTIVKTFTELHGGTIEVRSDGEGKGASFLVSLPRTDAGKGDVVLSAYSPPPSSELHVNLDESTLLGVKILAIDDDPYSRELLARVLSDAGAAVQTASTPTEAFTMLEAHRPDVLISDVSMPGEDGYEFVRRLRVRQDDLASLPCVAVTALSRPEDRERALTVGFDEHVGKPFDPGSLCLLLASLCGRRSQGENGIGPGAADGRRSKGQAHLLLVEDDPCIAEMFKTVLESEGYRVTLAESSAQAIATADPVDLVISDLVLKDGTSWNLLSEIKSQPRVPGILMSGYSGSEYVERSQAAGFSQYLVKPVDADDLIRAVARILETPRKAV